MLCIYIDFDKRGLISLCHVMSLDNVMETKKFQVRVSKLCYDNSYVLYRMQ